MGRVRPPFFLLVLCLSLPVFFSACMSPYTYQTAKVVQPDEFQLMWNGALTGVSRDDLLDPAVNLGLNPMLGFGSRFPMQAPRFDWGIQLALEAPLGFDVKYQFLGDEYSAFAAALSAGLSYSPRIASFYRSHERLDAQRLFHAKLPLLLTFDFNQGKTALTLIPTYRYSFNTVVDYHAAILQVNLRFRTIDNDGFKRYFTIEAHAGKSLKGTYRFDNLYFYGIGIGFQGIHKLDYSKQPGEKIRKRKKEHKVLFSY